MEENLIPKYNLKLNLYYLYYEIKNQKIKDIIFEYIQCQLFYNNFLNHIDFEEVLLKQNKQKNQ